MSIYRAAHDSKFQRENDATVAEYSKLYKTRAAYRTSLAYRLRNSDTQMCSPEDKLLNDAADRIEQLETLLREVYAAGVQIEKVLKG